MGPATIGTLVIVASEFSVYEPGWQTSPMMFTRSVRSRPMVTLVWNPRK